MKTNIRLIDDHIHIKDESGLCLLDLIEAMKEICRESDMRAFTILSIPSWDEEHILQNPLSILLKAVYSDKTYFFGGLDYYLYPNKPQGCNFDKQLIKLIDIGADGLKLIETKPTVRKNIGNIPYTDSSYNRLFEILEEKQMPILWHVGDPETFWDPEKAPSWAYTNGWFYGDSTFPLKDDLYSETESILKRYPKLSITFAHMFFLSADLERADNFLDTYKNVRFDLTPGSEMYGNFALRRDDWRNFFIKHQDQILFGTDGGWSTGEGIKVKIGHAKSTASNVRRFLETADDFEMCGFKVKGVDLPNDVLNKILCYNFIRVVGEKPKPLSIPIACDYCDEIMSILKSSECKISCKVELSDRLSLIKEMLLKQEK